MLTGRYLYETYCYKKRDLNTRGPMILINYGKAFPRPITLINYAALYKYSASHFNSVFVKHILLHISGSWPIRVRFVHSWAVFYITAQFCFAQLLICNSFICDITHSYVTHSYAHISFICYSFIYRIHM